MEIIETVPCLFYIPFAGLSRLDFIEKLLLPAPFEPINSGFQLPSNSFLQKIGSITVHWKIEFLKRNTPDGKTRTFLQVGFRIFIPPGMNQMSECDTDGTICRSLYHRKSPLSYSGNHKPCTVSLSRPCLKAVPRYSRVRPT